MIRAVLDANVVVSAILSPKGIPAKILTVWRAEEFSAVVSKAIVNEIARVLRYPKIKRRHRWPEKQILIFLEDLVRLSVFTPGNLSLSVIADDPTDNRYLEAGLEGEADYLVSGDEHLLGLVAYQGMQIVRPREFLTALKERQKS